MEWLSAVIPARIALVIVEVWATTPLCMLIFMAALEDGSRGTFRGGDHRRCKLETEIFPGDHAVNSEFYRSGADHAFYGCYPYV